MNDQQNPGGGGQNPGGAEQSRPLGAWLQASPLVPALAALVYAVSGFPHGVSAIRVLAAAVMTAAAAFLSGSLLGFLFGLPRALERAPAGAAAPPAGLLSTNTNLDQVSDWLTKVLVGLGLVELGKLSGGLNHLGAALAPSLGGEASAQSFAIALLVYSVVDGFLLGYLWTRIDLSPRLKRAAEDLAGSGVVLGRPLPDAPPPLPKPPVELGPGDESPPETGR
jgi:hypothetical protein